MKNCCYYVGSMTLYSMTFMCMTAVVIVGDPLCSLNEGYTPWPFGGGGGSLRGIKIHHFEYMFTVGSDCCR